MSKQRPYGSFEEAYILWLINNDNKTYKRFIKNCRGFEDLGKQGKTKRMRLPAIFLEDYKEYILFWQCLCRQYGEMFMIASDSYIYTDNLSMMLEYLDSIYEHVKDEPVLINDNYFEF